MRSGRRASPGVAATRLARPLLLSATLLLSPPGLGAGTPGASAEPVPEGETASSAARTHYAAGMAYKAEAWSHEAAALEATDAATQATAEAAARAAFEAAITAFGKALKLDLKDHEAANELGYALRRTGNYQKALGAYNFALTIKPDFYPAVEYRGEAYLALGRLQDAKDAYMTLFRNEPVLAAQLLEAMAAKATDAEFAAWVAERQQIAARLPSSDAASAADW
ncbi:MAG: tetratricopeptide repeat protein [Pseudomonadota bacterium]